MPKDATSQARADAEAAADERARHWQRLVGGVVALGCLVTAAYAVVETFGG